MSHEGEMIQVCLVCKLAWDIANDPPKCQEPTHPHACLVLEDWNEVGRGRVE